MRGSRKCRGACTYPIFGFIYVTRELDGEYRFLLAALQIDSSKHCTSVNGLRKTVNSLPSGLDAFYKRTLERIESQTTTEISLAILSLTFAFRSLSIAELQHALPVSDESEGLDGDDITEDNVIVSVCFGLITIDELFGLSVSTLYVVRPPKTADSWIRRDRLRFLQSPFF